MNSTPTDPPESEVVAKRLSGLVAERQREVYPAGVLVALRSVQRESRSGCGTPTSRSTNELLF